MRTCDRSKVGISDFFKAVDDIRSPDIRWQRDVDSALLKKFHLNIENIVLNNSVPNIIFVKFEAAKSTLLYSYFSYRLSMAAMIVAFAALESAITLKAEAVSGDKGMRGLSKKLDAVFAYKLIDIKNVVNPVNTPSDWEAYIKSVFIPYFVDLRNDLAHEYSRLDFPWRVCEDLNTIANMINELFDNKVSE